MSRSSYHSSISVHTDNERDSVVEHKQPIKYSDEPLSFKDRRQAVQVFYYKGHIAINILPIDNKDPKKTYDGVYFSYGGGNIRGDKNYYGEPAVFSLDLPEGMTYAKLNNLTLPDTKDYSLFRKNCADETLNLLHQLGYFPSGLAKVKTRLATTPQYAANIACHLAYAQNKKYHESVLNINKKNHTAVDSIDRFLVLIKFERERLEIERAQIKIKAAALAWDSFNLFKKAYRNGMQSSEVGLNKAKDSYLERLEDKVKLARNELPDTQSLQTIFDEITKRFPVSAKNNPFKNFMAEFPYDLLPDKKRKLNYLRELKNKILTKEKELKSLTLWGRTLPDGIIALKNKLKDVADHGDLENSKVQKIFMEVREILRDKVINLNSCRSGYLQTAYEQWYELSRTPNKNNRPAI